MEWFIVGIILLTITIFRIFALLENEFNTSVPEKYNGPNLRFLSCAHDFYDPRLIQIYTVITECDQSTSDRVFYFDKNYQGEEKCSLNVLAHNRHVLQLRIDFENFTLNQPKNPGNGDSFRCVDDMFMVTVNQQLKMKIPILCGENSGQHVYIPVSKFLEKQTLAILNFKFNTSSISKTFTPHWKLKVTQLEEGRHKLFWWLEKTTTDILAPEGCLQYFDSEEGEFESFNYNKGVGPYVGNTKYSICFKRTWNTCEIKFKVIYFQLGYNNDKLNYTDRDCDTKLEDFVFINDYLFIPDGVTETDIKGSKFCNNAIVPNKTIRSNVPGSFQIVFNSGDTLSDVYNSQRGFKLKFSILHDC